MNNEPIPHKRRRRQPSAASVSVTNDAPESTTGTKYAKKAPKPAAQVDQKHSQAKADTQAQQSAKQPTKAPVAVAETTKAAKSSQVADSLAIASKLNDNKGPIPHKRRRRQPSTGNA